MDDLNGWAAMLTAIAVLIGALLDGHKTRAEVRRTSRRTSAQTEAVHAQLQPNHGSSTRDAIARIETGLGEVRKDIGGLRAEIRSERDERQAGHQSRAAMPAAYAVLSPVNHRRARSTVSASPAIRRRSHAGHV